MELICKWFHTLELYVTTISIIGPSILGVFVEEVPESQGGIRRFFLRQMCRSVSLLQDKFSGTTVPGD